MNGHKYFATQRPLMPGTVPGNAKILEMKNFDNKIYCAEIRREAWGYLVTEKPLSADDIAGYEFIPEDADGIPARNS